MRKKFVVANWKMNPNSSVEARKIFNAIKKKVSKSNRSRIVICPPSLYISELSRSYRGNKIVFGGQDVSHKESGSHTGEISATMLKRSGAEYCIIGHSERRVFGETNDTVSEKVKSAINAGLKVILCVGESSRDENGDYLNFLQTELVESLKGVPKQKTNRLIIAYEPIWAIGKSAKHAMKMSDVHQMHLFIKKVLSKIYDRKAAMSIPIVYGGSVEPSNTAELISDADADGFLIGHASLVPNDFGEIVNIIEKR